MAATVSQIMTGLQGRLATITGLRTSDFLPDNINPPIAIPALDQINYHRASAGGAAVHEITVTVIVGAASERTAQARLDGYLSYSGPSSIRAAIEADPTLGGVASTSVVDSAGGITFVEIATTKYLVATFAVTVYA
jgi:hypothetical protein